MTYCSEPSVPASAHSCCLDLDVLGLYVDAPLPVQAFPFPARFHELGPWIAACAAFFQALVVAMAAAPSAPYMSYLLVLAE